MTTASDDSANVAYLAFMLGWTAALHALEVEQSPEIMAKLSGADIVLGEVARGELVLWDPAIFTGSAADTREMVAEYSSPIQEYQRQLATTILQKLREINDRT